MTLLTSSNSTRAAPRAVGAFTARLGRDLGKPVIVTDNWKSCVEGVREALRPMTGAAP